MYSVNTQDAYRLLKIALAADVVPHLVSSPGIGKSALIKKLAKEFNLTLIDYRASGGVPEDLSGLPFRNKDKAEFLPFTDIFPTKDTTIPVGSNGFLLFLDELNSASRPMLAALYKLILDRQVGQLDLHPQAYIVTAGNRMSDRAITNQIGTALQSRMVHIDIETDTQVWLKDVAYPMNYDHRVIAFISAFPNKLNDFDPDHNNPTFCCQRTWEFVNKLVMQFDEKEGLPEWSIPLFAGTVTPGVAVEFVQFTQVFKSIPTLKEVVNDPIGTKVPTEATLQWATVCSLAQQIKEDNFEFIAAYIDKYRLTFKLVFYRMVLAKNPDMRRNPEAIKAMVSIQKYLND